MRSSKNVRRQNGRRFEGTIHGIESVSSPLGVSDYVVGDLSPIRDEGYAGIEAGMNAVGDRELFGEALKQNGLEVIGQVYTAGFTKGHSADQHLRCLEAEVRELLPLEPVLVNIHSGEDTWPLDTMHRYFRGA